MKSVIFGLIWNYSVIIWQAGLYYVYNVQRAQKRWFIPRDPHWSGLWTGSPCLLLVLSQVVSAWWRCFRFTFHALKTTPDNQSRHNYSNFSHWPTICKTVQPAESSLHFTGHVLFWKPITAHYQSHVVSDCQSLHKATTCHQSERQVMNEPIISWITHWWNYAALIGQE